MNRFQNILFVSHGIGDEIEALRMAVRLASDNAALLSILVVYPGLGENLREHEPPYEATLAQRLRGALVQVGGNDSLSIKFERGSEPATKIIQYALRGGHDLVIKAAQPGSARRGFQAMDMDLLRKCPCPVWFCRPLDRTNQRPHVAVAVDPINTEPAGRQLALELLRLAQQLTQRLGGELSVISCWNYAREEYLRDHALLPVAAETLKQAVLQEQQTHRAELNTLLREAGIGEEPTLYHVKGRPEQIIPELTEQKYVDIMVMGTVARTGIPGFIIGNTAESVLRQLGCSLLALKPVGFVSPVKV